MEPGQLEAATEEALRLAKAEGIRGSATTPFLLAHVAKVTAGESIEANKALLVNNARWAARFACGYHDKKVDFLAQFIVRYGLDELFGGCCRFFVELPQLRRCSSRCA